MNRRESMLTLFAINAGAVPLGVLAQTQPGRGPLRIGLVPDFHLPAWEALLKQLSAALAGLGHVEGRDFVYIRSGVYYGPETQKALDRVLEAKPDLIVTSNLGYAVAAQAVTKTIPIVMWISGFPVEGGVAQSLARPGGNVTGLTIYAGGEVFGKLVQIVLEAKPGIKRIGALLSYVPPFHPQAETDVIVRGMRSAAQSLGVDLRIFEIARAEQVDDAFLAITRERIDAMVLTSDAVMRPRFHDILQFAADHRLPTVIDAGWESAGDPQPLLVYEADYEVLIRQAAPYIDKILWRGVKPGELPIQLPSRFVFSVNQKTAKAIGLTVPRSILVRADRVIE